MRRPAHVIPPLEGLSEYFSITQIQRCRSHMITMVTMVTDNPSKSDFYLVKLLPVSFHSKQGRLLDIPSLYRRSLIATHACLVSVPHDKSRSCDLVSMVMVTHLVTSSFWGLKKMNILYCPEIIYP